jgi:hypothetical protein
MGRDPYPSARGQSEQRRAYERSIGIAPDKGLPLRWNLCDGDISLASFRDALGMEGGSPLLGGAHRCRAHIDAMGLRQPQALWDLEHKLSHT